MGAAHSRARPGAGPAKVNHNGKQTEIMGGANAPSQGYFILCIKAGDRIKIVNASNATHKVLTGIIKRHFTIAKSNWDKNYAFSYKVQKTNRHSLIQFTADVLLTLYRAGWSPMTPIDLSVKGIAESQTAICFRRDSPEEEQQQQHYSAGGVGSSIPAHLNQHLSSGTPLSGSYEDIMQNENKECLCLETYGKNLLGFHDVPNTILFDLVHCVQQEWLPGIVGMSDAVSSVISDYMSVDLNIQVLPGEIDDRRYLMLHGKPWSQSEEGADLEDAMCAENLVISIVACLARAQYKLQISIQMDKTTTVFFFIRDKSCKEVRLPTFCGVGLGEKNSMYVYRPTITRNQKSFFGSRHGKGKSLRKRIKASFRRKTSKNGGNKEDDKDQQQPDGSDAVSEGGGAKRGGARKKSSSVSINPTPSIINPQGEGEGIAVSATAPSTPKTPARSQKVPQARCGSPSGSGASSNQKSSTKTMMGVKRTHLTVEDAENRL